MKKVIALLPPNEKQVITTRATAEKNNWWITYEVEAIPEHENKPHPDNIDKTPVAGMLLKAVNGNVYKISELKEVRTCFACGERATHRIYKKFYCEKDYNDLVITRPIKLLGPKQNRNDVCSCGSGKKYKNCCIVKEDHTRGHIYINKLNVAAQTNKTA